MKEAKLHLLLPPLGILLLGTGVLLLAHRLTADLLLLPWLAAVIVGAFFTQFILGRRDGTDLTLFPAAMLLASLGLIMIGRLKPALFLTQMRWLLLGPIVYLVLVVLGERFLRLLSYP